MNEAVKVNIEEADGGYEATVTVNGEFYASVWHRNQVEVAVEALHYAMGVEIDEDGNR